MLKSVIINNLDYGDYNNHIEHDEHGNYRNYKEHNLTAYRLSYLEWNNKNASETIICLHGVTRNNRDFDFLAKELSISGLRIIAIDMLGRGNSDYLNNYNLYNYEVYETIILKAIEQLQLKSFSLIGSSMGGIIAFHLACKIPERINALVINDAGPYVEGNAQQILYKYINNYPEFSSKREAGDYLRFFLAPLNIREEKHWQHLIEYSFKTEKNEKKPRELKYLLNFDPNILLAIKQRAPVNSNYWEIWNNIDKKIPILILRGAKSRYLSSLVLEKMLKSRENIRYFEYANTGHTPSLMDPKQIEDIKAWLLQALK